MDQRVDQAASEPGAGRKQLSGDPDWWRGAVVYHVYPRSFQDSNGDGIGDLAGITNRIDYIAGLGVDAIWISPFFVSPMDDFGYDVADYLDVDPIFGTLQDFDALMERAHQSGLRVIIDLVLSHTSDRHPWFVESRTSRNNPRHDWYVWADPKRDGTPPNNWLSIFGGPAWEWDTTRCQYYMHNFLTSQPDLNFHNADVQDAMLDVARFWLERGVDGFRLDTANMYVHDRELRDNPPLAPGEVIAGIGYENPLSMQKPEFNINRPETLTFHERLRALMDTYPGTMSIGEIGTHLVGGDAMAAYTAPGRLHMAYGFDLLGATVEAAHFRSVVESAEVGGATWSSWPFSNHDVPRVVTRFGFGPSAGPMLFQLLTSLGGTPSLYQGEELALPQAHVPYELIQDPYGKRFWPVYQGRDGCRTPMPWAHGAPHAGFTEGPHPWLPVDPDHAAEAVDVQAGNPASPLERARSFLAWRKGQPALITGGVRFLDAPEPILSFCRMPAEGAGPTLLCAFNLSSVPASFVPGVTVRPVDVPGVSGGSLVGGAVQLEGFGAFMGALTPTEEDNHG